MKALKTMTADALEGIIDFKVVDRSGENIGSLHSLWSDPATGAVEFLGVKTGWLFGHNHVVPAGRAELDETQSAIRLPYLEAFIKEAPSISADSEITEAEEARIYEYYGSQNPGLQAEVSATDATVDASLSQPVADALSGARALGAAGAERWRRVGKSAGGNAAGQAEPPPI